jgi:hypothetical protein
MPIVIVYFVTMLVQGSLSKRDLLTLFTIYLLDAVIHLGRFSFYYFAVVLLAGVLTGRLKLSLIKGGALGIAIMLLGVMFFSVRYGATLDYVPDLDIANYFVDSILNYHIVGFAILDKFVSGDVVFPDASVPVLWLGFVEGLVSSMLKVVGLSGGGPYATFGAFLQTVIIYTDNGYYNAFGTNILPYYLDGGTAFSVLAFFCVGAIICWPMNRTFETVGRFSLIVWIAMVMGIFQPVIVGPLVFVGAALIMIDKVITYSSRQPMRA